MNLDTVNKTIVDLNRTEWAKEHSDPARGIYQFTGDKVYVKRSDYSDAAARPAHVLKWIGFEDEEASASFRRYRQMYGAEPVTVDDPYFPELAEIDSSGHYRYMDTILVKIPLVTWLKKAVSDKEKAKRGHEVIDAGFKAQTKADGADIDIAKYL